MTNMTLRIICFIILSAAMCLIQPTTGSTLTFNRPCLKDLLLQLLSSLMKGQIPLNRQVSSSDVHTKFDKGPPSSWGYVVAVFRKYFNFIGKPLIFSIDLNKMHEIYFVGLFSPLQDTRFIRTPHYYTDSLLCPWGKKSGPCISINLSCLIRTPHYYGQFASSLGN